MAKYEERTRPYEEGNVYADGPQIAQAFHPMEGQSCLGRPGGRDELARLIEDLHRKAAGYQALLDALPAKLPPEADGVLWALVLKARQAPL